MTDTEEWRWAFTSPTGTVYEVSSLGRCRSKVKERPWRIITGSKHKQNTKSAQLTYRRMNGKSGGKRWQVLLHRWVAKAFLPNWNKLPCVDHCNGNGLDNRVVNLRWRSHLQNMQNQVGKGAHFRKDLQKWQAHICVNRRQIHLGYYLTEQTARAAYLAAKRRLHPECLARLAA